MHLFIASHLHHAPTLFSSSSVLFTHLFSKTQAVLPAHIRKKVRLLCKCQLSVQGLKLEASSRVINSQHVSCTHSLKQNKNRGHAFLHMDLRIGAQLWVVKAKDDAFKSSVCLIKKREVAFSAEHFMPLTP